MAVTVNQIADTNILEICVSAKLTKEDYEQFVPVTEQMIENGKIRIVFEMHDFHGWEVAALWEDIKFDVKHFSDIERLAMIGDRKWEQGMAIFCKPFTSAKIRYFDVSAADEARSWIREDG